MTTRNAMQTQWSVEVAAHLAGLSVPRVRRLVRAGLIEPVIVKPGRPMFGDVEVARLRKIRRLTTELGVNLAGVEVILRLTDELAVLRANQRPPRATSVYTGRLR
jgi:MerR family transcriptional regulator, heat shock protein HspR